MLATIERAHSTVGLDPDAEVFQFAIDAAAGGQQLFGMAPVHADKVQRAIDAECDEVAEGLAEKGGEFDPGHLPASHREGAMMDRAEPARVAVDPHIVGRIGENHRGAFLAHYYG